MTGQPCPLTGSSRNHASHPLLHDRAISIDVPWAGRSRFPGLTATARLGKGIMATVFSFGIAVIDIVFHLEQLPVGDSKHFTRKRDLIGGGCAANAAVTISRLGGKAMLSCRLGDDIFGDMILADLERFSLDLSMLRRFSGCDSPYSAVCLARSGERQVVNYRGTFVDDYPGWVADAPTVDTYLSDTVWMQGCQAVLARAKKADRPGIVDAERVSDLDQVLDATHLAFSRQGIHALTGAKTPVEGLRAIRGATRAWCCVTDGASGVYFHDGDSIEQISAFEIDAVDTLAAGDVWHGAFALGIAENMTETDAMIFANATAALKCSRHGGRDNYPVREEVEDLIANAG